MELWVEIGLNGLLRRLIWIGRQFRSVDRFIGSHTNPLFHKENSLRIKTGDSQHTIIRSRPPLTGILATWNQETTNVVSTADTTRQVNAANLPTITHDGQP